MSRTFIPYRWGIAVIVLALAALACAVQTSSARLDDPRLYRSATSTNATRSFTPGDPFHLRTALHHASGRHTVGVIWYAVGADGGATEIGQREQESGGGALNFSLEPPEGGWTVGDYRAVQVLDGTRKQSIDFRVKE